jgi:lipopolysaccharide transport system permease protein
MGNPSVYSGATRVLTPSRAVGLRATELWRYRELLLILTWRDVSVRYKQTLIGVSWILLQPLLTIAVFSLFFGRLAGLEHRTGGIPYPIYVCAGLLPWTFFANSTATGGVSLISNINLVTKVYFPRLLVPFASVGAALVDLAVSLAVLLVLMLVYSVPPTWQLLAAPLAILGLLLVALGVASFMAAATAEYRDLRYVLPFLLQLWLFVTPVIYPTSLVPDSWRWCLFLNPLTGLIETFRAAFLGLPVGWATAAASLVTSAAAFLIGCFYFRWVERRLADTI